MKDGGCLSKMIPGETLAVDRDEFLNSFNERVSLVRADRMGDIDTSMRLKVDVVLLKMGLLTPEPPISEVTIAFLQAQADLAHELAFSRINQRVKDAQLDIAEGIANDERIHRLGSEILDRAKPFYKTRRFLSRVRI